VLARLLIPVVETGIQVSPDSNKTSSTNMNRLLSYFSASTPSNTGSSNRAAITKIFDKYRDSPKDSPDEINLDGTSNLLNELEIDVTDVGALVFFELVQSPSLGVITRQGCIDGLMAANADSIPKIRTIVQQRRAQLPSGGDAFRVAYNHTFALALQDRQKSLAMEIALEFWTVLFSSPAFEWQTGTTPWREWWLEFYQENVKRAVNKDLWKQTLNFALETVKDDSLGFWSEESSWPSVIDEFVAWAKEKRGGEAMDTN
jgi:DCN1-like protein 1/2